MADTKEEKNQGGIKWVRRPGCVLFTMFIIFPLLFFVFVHHVSQNRQADRERVTEQLDVSLKGRVVEVLPDSRKPSVGFLYFRLAEPVAKPYDSRDSLGFFLVVESQWAALRHFTHKIHDIRVGDSLVISKNLYIDTGKPIAVYRCDTLLVRHPIAMYSGESLLSRSIERRFESVWPPHDSLIDRAQKAYADRCS